MLQKSAKNRANLSWSRGNSCNKIAVKEYPLDPPKLVLYIVDLEQQS